MVFGLMNEDGQNLRTTAIVAAFVVPFVDYYAVIHGRTGRPKAAVWTPPPGRQLPKGIVDLRDHLRCCGGAYRS